MAEPLFIASTSPLVRWLNQASRGAFDVPIDQPLGGERGDEGYSGPQTQEQGLPGGYGQPQSPQAAPAGIPPGTAAPVSPVETRELPDLSQSGKTGFVDSGLGQPGSKPSPAQSGVVGSQNASFGENKNAESQGVFGGMSPDSRAAQQAAPTSFSEPSHVNAETTSVSAPAPPSVPDTRGMTPGQRGSLAAWGRALGSLFSGQQTAQAPSIDTMDDKGKTPAETGPGPGGGAAAGGSGLGPGGLAPGHDKEASQYGGGTEGGGTEGSDPSGPGPGGGTGNTGAPDSSGDPGGPGGGPSWMHGGAAGDDMDEMQEPIEGTLHEGENVDTKEFVDLFGQETFDEANDVAADDTLSDEEKRKAIASLFTSGRATSALKGVQAIETGGQYL
jgi:hypothetical protein